MLLFRWFKKVLAIEKGRAPSRTFEGPAGEAGLLETLDPELWELRDRNLDHLNSNTADRRGAAGSKTPAADHRPLPDY